MVEITIKVPIWFTRSVGIADSKIVDDLKVVISYTDSSGERIWPKPLYISQTRARMYPVQIRKGTKLRIIPIEDLQEKE